MLFLLSKKAFFTEKHLVCYGVLPYLNNLLPALASRLAWCGGLICRLGSQNKVSSFLCPCCGLDDEFLVLIQLLHL